MRSHSQEALEALAAKLSIMRPSLENAARSRGVRQVDVEDSVSDFFAYLFRTQVLEAYDPSRGIFELFTRACFKKFVLNYLSSSKTQRRGGGILHFSYEETFELSGLEDEGALSPEIALERDWLQISWEMAFKVAELATVGSA